MADTVETIEPGLDSATLAAAMERTQELVALLAEAMGDSDEACFQYPYADQIEEIETVARDGFWPWTSGGHHVCLAAAISHHSATGAAPSPIQPMIDATDKMIADEWARQFPDRPSHVDCISAGKGELGHEWQIDAEQWEFEAWQGDTDCYYYKARAMIVAPSDHQNESGQWEVYIDAYLCSDSYGRDSIPWLSCYGQKTDQTAGDFKRTIPLCDFVAMDSAALEALASEAVATLP